MNDVSVCTDGWAKGGRCAYIRTGTDTKTGNGTLIKAGGGIGVHGSGRTQAGNRSRLNVRTAGKDWDSRCGFSLRLIYSGSGGKRS